MAKDLLTGKQIVEEKIVKEKEKAKSPLFDLLNLMFKDPKKFEKIPGYEKGKHLFMLNRFFSIKYPIQAQMLNKLNINGVEAIQYWASTLTKLYSSTPTWIWEGLKGVKVKKEQKKKEIEIKESTIKYYCLKMQLSKSEVEYAIKTLGDPFKKELLNIEKMINQ